MNTAKRGIGAAISLGLCFILAGCTGENNSITPSVNIFESPVKKASRLYLQGKYVEAELEAEKAVKEKKDTAFAYCILAEALNAQGRFDEAEVFARQAISMEPGIANSHAAMARALNGSGSFDEAEPEARAALKRPISDMTPVSRAGQQVLLGTALQGQALQGNIAKFAEADLAYKAAIQADPNFAPAQLSEGVLLSIFGKWKDAEPYLKKAVELEPNNAAALSALIVCSTNLNQLDEAMRLNEKLAQLTPKDPAVNVMLANIYYREGKFAEAETEVKNALKLNPNFGPAYTTLTAVLCKQKKAKEATAAGIKAIQLTPTDPLAHLALAQAWADSGQWMFAGGECMTAYGLAALNKPLQDEVQKLGNQVASHLPKPPIPR